ncbi:hypothetical protein N0V94_001621 [Neodidymelliopsis sp. IMI 364377]|nr:hypothetical protein N0V94_001621 [Neodidymelliopsis sp. IMI 364377]
MQAATIGNIAYLTYASNVGADINIETEDGKTALHCAARAGQTATVQFLLAKGARQNKDTQVNGRRILNAAAEAVLGRSLDCFILLLEAGAQFGYWKARGIMDHIAQTGDLAFAQSIMDTDIANWSSDEKATVLAWEAAKAGATSILEYLIVHHPMSMSNIVPIKATPLYAAAIGGSLACFRLLLATPIIEEVDSEVLSSLFDKLLQKNAAKGNAQTVQATIDDGEARTKRPNFRFSQALFVAVSGKNIETMSVLLRYTTTDINSRLHRWGETALHCAARYGFVEGVKLLLSHSCVDVRAKNTVAQTPMLSAFWAEKLDCVHLLAEYESVEIRDALREAQTITQMGCILLDHGIIELRSAQLYGGKDLFCIAIEAQDTTFLKKLLTHPEFRSEYLERRIWHQSCFDWTILQLARKKGYQEMVNLLQEYGAIDPDSPENAPEPAQTVQGATTILTEQHNPYAQYFDQPNTQSDFEFDLGDDWSLLDDEDDFMKYSLDTATQEI